MKIICSGRGSGKTMLLIQESARSFAYIVVHGQIEAKRVADIAQRNGLDIPFPMTYAEFLGKRYHSKGVKGFLIDNAERLLQAMTDVNIMAITVMLPDNEEVPDE